jgi:hypothetical protein
LEFTVSTAERIATFGSLIPSACASSMAFLTISTLSLSKGKMFTAASVMKSALG